MVGQTVVTVLLVAIIFKFVDFVRQLSAGAAGRNAVITQLVSWVSGVGLTLLVAQTAFADSVGFGGVTLAHAGIATQIIIGLALASGASTVNDARTTFNSTSDATPPKLLDDTTTNV